MKSAWELFGAFWSDDPADNDRPDVGDGAGYVPTLQANNFVKWALPPGGGAPDDAEYLVATSNGDLTAERVATDTATVAWDFATGGQAKANVPNDAITNAKLANMATDKLKARVSSGTGDPEDIDFPDFAQSLLDDTSASQARGTLGVYSQAEVDSLLSGATPSGASLAFTRREYWHGARGGANAVDTVGWAGPSGGGTSASADDVNGPLISVTTAAVTNSVAGYGTSFLLTRRDWLSRFVGTIKTGSVLTSVGYWVGWHSVGSTGVADPASDHGAAFRYHTTADGTAFWRTYTKDGTTAEVQTTSVAVATDTFYRLRIHLLASSVEFYINDVLVTTHATNIPSATTKMGWVSQITALSNNARTFYYGRTWFDTP